MSSILPNENLPEPRVSVVMATYNGAKFIREQLESLRSQTQTPYELIVRDDGSTDGTVAIVEDYGRKNHRFVIRPQDSDLFVASQIFGHREYDIGHDLRDRLRRLADEWRAQGITPIIVDAGANVGYSALYFADCFSGATILAIEPDSATFQMLKRNCRDASAISPVHAALWSHEEGVSLTQSAESGSWANAVQDGGTVPSAKLERLIGEVKNGRLLIVKLDIEGAEREVCGASASVFETAPVIIVEPHDFMLPGAACLAPLYRALASRQMDTLISGENLIFADSRLLAPLQTKTLASRGESQQSGLSE